MPHSTLDHGKAQIEQHLGWGDAADWTTRDFEDLSFRIQEQTGRAISATTLKRIWGRVAYQSSPSRHSLDTLALFLGYPSWRAFEQTVRVEVPSLVHVPQTLSAEPVPVPPPVSRRRTDVRLLYLALPVLALVLAFAWYVRVQNAAQATDEAVVQFTSRPVTSGVPNTVIFEYNLSGIEADSFFIQQSWDERRRTQVDPTLQTYTSTYYRPGFFNAKLIADDRIIAEHPLHITTNGWIALIDGARNPIYLTDAFATSAEELTVTPAWLREQGYDADASHQVVEYYNVRSFDSVQTDGFTLETAIRRTINTQRYPCGRAGVTVLGERGAFELPLAQPGCVGDLGLLLGMNYLAGTTNDLSTFGTDLATWQRVQLEVNGTSVRVQIGQNSAFVGEASTAVGQVIGLRFQFEGAGAVDYVTLRDADGVIVYEEAF